MTAKTRAELLGDADTRLPDNSGGLIKPKHVRDQVKETAESALFPEDLAAADSKATPVNADALPLIDSVDGAFKLLSWAALKAALKGYFDDIYAMGADLATVAFSGSYNDLGDKPTIPAATPDATTSAKGKVQLATAANLRASAAGELALTSDLVAGACELVILTDAATIAVDWSSFLVAQVTQAGNRTFGNPTNVKPGTTRYIVVKGDSATARTLSFAANYKGDMPDGTVTSTSWLMIGLTALAANHIVVTSCKAF